MKQLPVVPLFGDMHLSLMSYIKMSPNFDATKWTAGSEMSDAKANGEQYNILTMLDGFKADRDQFINDLTLMQARVRYFDEQKNYECIRVCMLLN